MKRLIVLLALLFLPCVTYAETYCLKVEEGDAIEHCDYTQYDSFSQIRDRLSTGDVVDGMGKTFYETWWLSDKNNITLKNAIIDAQETRDFGIWLSGTDSVNVEGITVKSSVKNAIWIVGNSNNYSKNITIDNCTVENSLKDGIVVYSGSENVTINQSRIINPTSRGIYVWAYQENIKSITITNTEIIKDLYTPSGNKHGIHLYTEGYTATTEISDILISGNTITLGNPDTGERIGDFGIWVQANGPASEIVDDVQVPVVYFYDLEISNNEVSYGQSGGVAVGGVNTRNKAHNIIKGNLVHNNGPHSDTSKPTHSMGIGTSANIIVSNNLFHDNLSNGFDGVGVFLDILSSELIVRYNTTFGHNYARDREPYGTSGAFNSSGIGICCGAHDNEVYYNVSYGNTAGISIGQALPVGGLGKIHHVYNNKIYNNVFALNEVGIVNQIGYVPSWAWNHNGIPHVEVIPENCDATNNYCNELNNNIIYGNYGLDGRPGAGMWTRDGAISPAEENNIFYGNAEDIWDNGTNLSNNTTEDPSFVDPLSDNPDFSLSPSSPAIDSGTYVGLTMDYCGHPVTVGVNPDIGAYEWPSDLTITWNGLTSGDWNDLNNWNTGIVPGSCDNVIIVNGINNTALSSVTTVKNLTIESGELMLDSYDLTVGSIH